MKKTIQKLYKVLFAFNILLPLVSMTGCKKLVEAPIPSEKMADENVYSNDATAIAVLDGIYISMNANNQPFQGINSIGLLAGLSSDELTLYSGFTTGMQYRYYTNNLAQSGVDFFGAEHWNPLYNYIFRCNAAIEGLTTSKTITPSIKQQILGEAKFLRAFYYFYLVNLFGDVPLVLSTDPQINSSLARSTKDLVYKQIVLDLKDAEELLNDNYLDGALLSKTTDRVRPTKWAATALLARVYLYTNQWDKAEDRASLIINNTTLFGPISSIPLNNVFQKNSREAIWQLQPTNVNFNTVDGQVYIITSFGLNGSNPVYLSNNLLNSFEAGDQRAIDGNWVNTRIIAATTYRYPYKYKINSSPGVTDVGGMSEYFMVLRLGEQYLIRAEARAKQGNIGGAQSDLNAIRNRAGLPNTIAADQPSLLTALLHERQVELFTEWGHRWFDLKRTANVDAVMNIATSQKSNGTVIWQPYQQLYPLPLWDLQKNLNLKQNNGY